MSGMVLLSMAIQVTYQLQRLCGFDDLDGRPVVEETQTVKKELIFYISMDKTSILRMFSFNSLRRLLLL